MKKGNCFLSSLCCFTVFMSLVSPSFVSCSNTSETGAQTRELSPNEITSTSISQISDISADLPSLMEELLAAYSSEDSASCRVYYFSSQEGDDSFLDPNMLGDYAHGEYAADVPEFASVSDFAMLIPESYHVFEIDILKSETKEGRTDAESFLRQRLEQKNNGDIVQYRPEEVPYLEEAEIKAIGSYVILLATTDNSIAEKILIQALNSSES